MTRHQHHFFQVPGFYAQPILSKHWDEQIGADPDLQKDISKSRKAQTHYGYVEARIASDHANLIDHQLRKAFQQLEWHDFANVDGYAKDSKATPNQRMFFKVRNILSHYIHSDIKDHELHDSKLHAFRRWISVAELLLKKHNYEAVLMVVTTLFEIDVLYRFTKELPDYSKEQFNSLMDLCAPNDFFKTIDAHIKKYKKNEDLVPVSILSSRLTSLDTRLEGKYLSPYSEPVKSEDLVSAKTITTQLLRAELTSLDEDLGDNKHLNSSDVLFDHPLYLALMKKKQLNSAMHLMTEMLRSETPTLDKTPKEDIPLNSNEIPLEPTSKPELIKSDSILVTTDMILTELNSLDELLGEHTHLNVGNRALDPRETLELAMKEKLISVMTETTKMIHTELAYVNTLPNDDKNLSNTQGHPLNTALVNLFLMMTTTKLLLVAFSSLDNPLGEDKCLNNTDIRSVHSSPSELVKEQLMYALMITNRMIFTAVEAYSRQVAMEPLISPMLTKKAELTALPAHLQSIFEAAAERYRLNPPSPRLAPRPERPADNSSLFSQKLCPTLRQRRYSSANKHWKGIFEIPTETFEAPEQNTPVLQNP